MENPFCPSLVVERISSCIPVDDPNRVTQVILVRKGTSITKTSVPAFITSVQTAELACNAIVFRNVNGTLAGPNYTEEPGRGSQVTQIVGGGYELAFTDFEAINNVDGMNAARRTSHTWDMFICTPTRVFFADGKTLAIKPGIPISDDVQSFIKGNWVITWSGADVLTNIKGSTEALATIPELGAVTLANFGLGTATIAGQQITIASAAALEVEVNFASAATTYGVDDDSTLPTGLVLDDETGQLTGSVATDGEYTFNIIGRNACGIAGLAEITLIVT